MNKLIVLLLTFSLISCVQQVEPIDENAEPAKLNQILVSEIKTDRAQISWSQDVAGTGYVEYGFTTSYGSISPMQKSNLLDHTIQLANLSADTVYHYKIVSVDKNLNRVLSDDMTFKTAKVEATPAPTPTPTPSPVKEAKAPSLIKAVLSGDNYVLTLSQAADSLTPAGGYDTFINNQDQNDNASFSGLTRTISGLDKTKEQCFKVEARYTQLTPQVFPSSNEICVAGFVAAPVVKNPVLMKATLSGDNYLLTLSQPAGSILPSGGYDTFINNQDQNDNASFSGLTRTISGLDKTKEQCFKVEARYTQLTPQVFPSSNEICVAGVSAPAPSPTPTPIPTPPPSVPGDDIVLDKLKAFPGAFGAGEFVTGGRGGKIYEVTNLNDSGPGSFRAAIEARGKRIALIKVEGRVVLKSRLTPSSSSNGDLSIIGQTAPGYGITISNDIFTITNAGNFVIRHLTVRNGNIARAGYGSFGLREVEKGKGAYVDHSSFSYGLDQIFDIIARYTDQNFTAAHNLIGEGIEGHNTGGIFGTSGNASVTTGNYTIARNMFYNVTHRTPNMSGSVGNFQHYNNYIVNWQTRLCNVNGGVHIDWFNNYLDEGNRKKSSSAPVNKWKYSANSTFKVYNGFNYMGGIDETPSDDQRLMWVYYKNNSSAGVVDNAPIAAKYYQKSRMLNYTEPKDGVWNALEVPTKITSTVGHNRGTDSDGNPVFRRDDLDASYIKKSLNGTTESTYRTSSQWNYPNLKSGFTPFKDSDGDGMADSFEDAHGLDKNNANDGLGKKLNWDFGKSKVINKAGYYNREIYWAYLAGDF